MITGITASKGAMSASWGPEIGQARADNSLMPTVVIKHPVPDRVQPSFVIFDIRAL